jgi:hypothetical protein
MPEKANPTPRVTATKLPGIQRRGAIRCPDKREIIANHLSVGDILLSLFCPGRLPEYTEGYSQDHLHQVDQALTSNDAVEVAR